MRRWLVASLIAVAGCGAAASPVQRVGMWDLAKQRVGGETSVVVPGEGLDRNVAVLVTVGVDGSVIQAKALDDSGYHLDPAPALAAVRVWRFRPQQFDGAAIEAVGRVQVTYVTPKVAPTAVSFPAIDPDRAVITMTRGACFGTCPAYTVSISGAELVRFSTEDETVPGASEIHRRYNGSGVLWPGVHTAQVDPVAARGLIERVRQIGFVGLKDEYSCPVTDQSTTQLTFAAPGVKKTVVDYVGECVGMPRAVSALEDEIDRVAGSTRWVSGTPETLALLEKNGFDPRSTAGAEFAAALALRTGFTSTPEPATAALIELLLDRGVRLDAMVERPMPWGNDKRPGSRVMLGQWLLGRAVEERDAKLLAKLSDRGVLARTDPAALTEMFHRGAACSPEIARALVKTGADPRHPPADGSALTAVRKGYGACDGRTDNEVAAIATTMLELGVPIEARDDLGWTALMGVDSPALARVLLAGHANLNARDKEGTTPLLSTDDDRVALILLRAGADPHVKDEHGSLREQAVKQHMPATLAWLDEHAIPSTVRSPPRRPSYAGALRRCRPLVGHWRAHSGLPASAIRPARRYDRFAGLQSHPLTERGRWKRTIRLRLDHNNSGRVLASSRRISATTEPSNGRCDDGDNNHHGRMLVDHGCGALCGGCSRCAARPRRLNDAAVRLLDRPPASCDHIRPCCRR